MPKPRGNSRKGGRTTLLRHGRTHFRELARLSQAARARNVVVRIGFTPVQVQQQQELAARTGRSRAALLRQAWDWWYASEWGEKP